MLLANRYCYGTAAQRGTLIAKKIVTVEDLLCAVRKDVNENIRFERNPQKTGVIYPVYKKHVIYFMKHQCDGLFVDFTRLTDNKVLITDGKFPFQWYGIQKLEISVVDVVPKPLPSPEIQPSCVHHMNGCMDEEEAFGVALRQSVIEMPPSPVLKNTSTHMTSDPIMHFKLPFEEAPLDLCCPITLALYIDPVQTIKGQTYERAAIEDWFKTHKTDPMTGEALLTTDVFQDADMLSKCKQHACKSVSVRPIGGRGGRGIGRMEQGGRGGRG